MHDHRLLVAGAAAAVVTLAASCGSPAAHHVTAAAHTKSHPATVDGIPNGARVSAVGQLQHGIYGPNLCIPSTDIVLDSYPATHDYDCGDLLPLRSFHFPRHAREVTRMVIGTWRSGAIVVSDLKPAPPDPDFTSLAHPPCPEPTDGWAQLQNYNALTPNLDERALDHYRHTHPHALTAVAIFRPEELRPVATVASTEPAATRAALGPAYPNALCVVASKFSWEELHNGLRRLRKALYSHRVPGMYELGPEIRADGQPAIEVGVHNDRPQLDEVLRGIPRALIDLHTTITILAP